MFSATISRLRCPVCRGALALSAQPSHGHQASAVVDLWSGELRCKSCPARYPILAGVAVLVENVHEYLLEHVKGVAQVVPDEQIPSSFRRDYLAAKREIVSEHIEEDLESERVTALYLANHYLQTHQAEHWWKAMSGSSSPLVDTLIREYWDHGPLAQVTGWVTHGGQAKDVVELGCGVGGLCRMLGGTTRSYLGVDSSFAGIALGRHLALGAAYARRLAIPNDLLAGPLSRTVKIPAPPPADGNHDLVVGDLAALPVAEGQFDFALALNAIDMMPEPWELPIEQFRLLKAGGQAIQSCPYIWHESVARKLRARLPKDIRDSGAASEWLYEQAGLQVVEKCDHLPWLFFKHARQLEIYSVQAFRALKPPGQPPSPKPTPTESCNPQANRSRRRPRR